MAKKDSHSLSNSATAGPTIATSSTTVGSNLPAMASTSTSNSAPSVVTTSLVQIMRLADGKKMINQYVMDARVGQGHHGYVWRCYSNADYYNLLTEDSNRNGDSLGRTGKGVLAMKIVKRDTPLAKKNRQMKMMRARAKESREGNSNGSGSGNGNGLLGKPRTTPTVVDGIRTAEQEIRKEIAIMKKCRHPHVVRLYEVIDDRKNDMVFMVMEYLGGGEVKYANSNGEPLLRVDQTRRIMRDAILGLEYLHHQGIIHRDIKPANLLWTEGHDRVKIADFGTAHFSYAQRLAAAKASGSSTLLETEEDPLLLNDADLAKRAGTPAFLAPEIVWEHTKVAEGATPPPRPPVTKSIDIWALGVTLYCLLFGNTPFQVSWDLEERAQAARARRAEVLALSGTGGDVDPESPQLLQFNDPRRNEFFHYNWVCNSEWTVPETMGYDRVETGGRWGGETLNSLSRWDTEDDANSDDEASRTKSKEGAIIMHLLDHFLQKDLDCRITLEEVKMNQWFLHDLPNPDFWLRMTSPADAPSGAFTGPSDQSISTESNIPILDARMPAWSTSRTTDMTERMTVQRERITSTTTFASTFSASASSSASSTYQNATPSRDSAALGQESITSSLTTVEKINVTEQERDDAMSVAKFRWNPFGNRAGSRPGSRSGSRPTSGIGVPISASNSMGVGRAGEAQSEGRSSNTAPATRLAVSTQGQEVHTSTHQVQHRGSLSRLSHRITNFLRGAVPSRSRDSLPSHFAAAGAPSSSSAHASASASSPNVSSSSNVAVTSDRNANSSRRGLSGNLGNSGKNRNLSPETGKGRWRDRARGKGRSKRKTNDDSNSLRDRGPVTSEPNMRSRARREATERQTVGGEIDTKGRGGRERRRGEIDKLEAAVAGTMGARSKKERRAKEGNRREERDSERTPRMSDNGTRRLPSLSREYRQDKGKGKAKDLSDSPNNTPRPMSSPLPPSPSLSPSPSSTWNLPTPITPSPVGSQSPVSTSPVHRILSTLSSRSRSGWRSSVSLGHFTPHSRNLSASSDIVVASARTTEVTGRSGVEDVVTSGSGIPTGVYAALGSGSGSGAGTVRPCSLEGSDEDEFDFEYEDGGGSIKQDADEFDDDVDFEDRAYWSDDVALLAAKGRVRRTSSWDHHPPELEGLGIIKSFAPERVDSGGFHGSASSAYGTASGSGSEVPSPTTPLSPSLAFATASTRRTRYVREVGSVEDDDGDDMEAEDDDEDVLMFSTGKQKKREGTSSTS